MSEHLGSCDRNHLRDHSHPHRQSEECVGWEELRAAPPASTVSADELIEKCIEAALDAEHLQPGCTESACGDGCPFADPSIAIRALKGRFILPAPDVSGLREELAKLTCHGCRLGIPLTDLGETYSVRYWHRRDTPYSLVCESKADTILDLLHSRKVLP